MDASVEDRCRQDGIRAALHDRCDEVGGTGRPA
jgi:hypothetical protein